MSGVQDKLYNYEQTPPGKVWEKIAAALDESHLNDEFPSKIYNAEAMPPAASWDKIVSSLETEHAGAIPMPRRGIPLLRYAAAAAIIGLITFGAIKWMGGNSIKSSEGIAVSHDSTNADKNSNASGEKNSSNPGSKNENPVTDDGAIEVATTGGAKASTIKRTKTRYSITSDIGAAEPIYAYNEHTPNLADRYIMLMTPDGGIVRMSKKLGNLVCCVSGQEQDENCKDQLKKLQEKMARSPMTSSAGNFMDILSLASSLNDTEL